MVDHPLEQTNLMTLDEFIRTYSKHEPIEIINGKLNYLMPMVAGQGIASSCRQGIIELQINWSCVFPSTLYLARSKRFRQECKASRSTIHSS